MKVLILNANKEDGLSKISSLCTLTFDELGVDVVEYDLEILERAKLLKKINEATDILILTNMKMNNIPASVQMFFEMFEDLENTLVDKKIFPIVISDRYNPLDGYKIILANLLQLGCTESDRIIAKPSDIKKSYIEEKIKKMCKSTSKVPKEEKKVEDVLHKKPISKLEDTKPKQPVNKVEDDIVELAEIFKQQLSQKIGTEIPKEASINENYIKDEISVLKMTKNLIHYFQPQLAADMDCVYQICVTGDEEFEGYLTIKNKDCAYGDRSAKDGNVIISVDSGMWKLILLGSISAQKAFMTGKIKVKGDFSLLAKFDKIFKKM